MSRIAKIGTHSLLIANKQDWNIKPGDKVSIHVLKNLASNKWAVAIKGQVLPAQSDLHLVPGQILTARAILQEGKLLLKLAENESHPLDELLKRLSIPQDKIHQNIVSQLLRNGQTVNYETVMIMKKALFMLRREDIKSMRLLSLLLSKNIDLFSENIEILMQILEFGGRKRRKDHQNRKNQSQKHESSAGIEEVKKDIKKHIRIEPVESASPLVVFNHLQGKPRNWMVIPFDMEYSGEKLEGNIRILYNDVIKRIERLSFNCIRENGVRWGCSINLNPARKNIQIFTDSEEERLAAQKKISNLKIKLENKGFIIDDIIYEDTVFDGFVPDWEEFVYKQIDVNL